MTGPQRFQRRRVRGYRMPPGSVYVGRGSRWGNPFTVEECGSRQAAVDALAAYLADRKTKPPGWSSSEGPSFPWESQIAQVLRGQDLVCWCPPDEACHADLLLKIANPES